MVAESQQNEDRLARSGGRNVHKFEFEIRVSAFMAVRLSPRHRSGEKWRAVVPVAPFCAHNALVSSDDTKAYRQQFVDRGAGVRFQAPGASSEDEDGNDDFEQNDYDAGPAENGAGDQDADGGRDEDTGEGDGGDAEQGDDQYSDEEDRLNEPVQR